MDIKEQIQLKERLLVLEAEHKVLNAHIDEMANSVSAHQLDLARLKKRKLLLKEEIVAIRNRIIPDILA